MTPPPSGACAPNSGGGVEKGTLKERMVRARGQLDELVEQTAEQFRKMTVSAHPPMFCMFVRSSACLSACVVCLCLSVLSVCLSLCLCLIYLVCPSFCLFFLRVCMPV